MPYDRDLFVLSTKGKMKTEDIEADASQQWRREKIITENHSSQRQFH